MKTKQFQQLLVDCYKIAKRNPNLIGVIYSAISTYGFSEIADIETFAKNSAADMLHLESKRTHTEIDVYEYNLINYTIKDANICIKLRNKTITLEF